MSQSIFLLLLSLGHVATWNSSATVILSCPSLPFFASDQTSVSGAPLQLLCMFYGD